MHASPMYADSRWTPHSLSRVCSREAHQVGRLCTTHGSLLFVAAPSDILHLWIFLRFKTDGS